jgi:hypothetical protein
MRCKKYCLGACTNLGRCNPCRLANRYKISELIPFIVTGPPVIHSSSLPFCLRFKMALRAQGSYRHPARLDTGRVASTYPGGISTRLSINHFQSARPTLCSDFHGLRGIEMVFVSRNLASATILFKSLSNLPASSRLIRRISSLIVSIFNSPKVHPANKSAAAYIQSPGKSAR